MLKGLKLSNQLLLLVLTPLFLELGFVCWLYCAFSDMERKAEQAENARQISTHINKFLRGAMAIAAKNRFSEANPDLLVSNEEIVQECRQELHLLYAYTEKDPEEKKLLDNINATIEEGLSQAIAIQDCIAKRDLVTAVKLRKELPALLSKTMVNLEAFRKEAARLEDFAPHIVHQRQDLIRQALVVGVTLNVLIALALAFIANKGLVQRLRILSDNAKAVELNLPLQDSPGGNDEIAQLDKAFREMAAGLSAARAYEKMENERLQQIIHERNELDKMKQQFVAVVSHELRTPLTNMGMFLDMVKKGLYGHLDESGMQVLPGVQNGVDRLIKLTTDLMDVERLEAGALHLEIIELPIERCIDAAINTVSRQSEAKGITIDFKPSECSVKGDNERIVQVVVNLLSNAIKFCPKGSTVSIQCIKGDAMVRIEISDNGPGISRELHEKIFDRFQQVNIDDAKKLGGAGLGLAICKSIVEQHGGQIGIESELGAGAKFWFTLPLCV